MDTKLPKAENRKLDYYFRFPFEVNDTTVYILPAGYKLDVCHLLKNLKLNTQAIFLNAGMMKSNDLFILHVQIILKQHVIPAAKYAEIKKFFDDVLINDGQKIVIKKE